MGEFIEFIDAVSCRDLWGPFSLAYNELNTDGGTERRRLRHFTRIDSDVYLQLSEHFEHVFEEWAQESDVKDEVEDADED